ncbi:MAG TPA: GHKL domain-containing protein [Gammaproteobacteria bacterium]|nr:GHKL domain-containing protein [Gammaproteobacteria bacterium]
MIVKPFFDRFKPPPTSKPDISAHTEKLLLRMLSFSIKLEDNEETLLRIASAISFGLNVDTVCISEIHDKTFHIRQIFHLGENFPLLKENSALVHSGTLLGTPEKYCDEIKIALQRSKISHLNSAMTCTAPAISNEGATLAFIHLFHGEQKNFLPCENKILELMAERVALFFQRKNQQKNHLPNLPSNENKLSQQLVQTEEQLAATNKSLKSLSYAVSHDLRAPLRSIDNFSAALVEDFAEALPDEATNTISRIRRACVRMGNMIDDLLWLARVSRGKIELQNIEFSKLVKKIALNLITNEEGRKIDLNIQSSLTVTADAGLLKIAIQNLFSNAIKFTRDEENTKIEFFAEQQGNTLVFAIRDNGLGFDMAYYEQLFEPFKQLHNANQYTGTGIGLATVKRIIERHHGKIWAESDINEGATFYFTLPDTACRL